MRPDDSSRSVTEKRAERTDAPTTADEALRLAIKLAVDAGEFERASALLDVAKRTATTKQASVTPIGEGRGRSRTS